MTTYTTPISRRQRAQHIVTFRISPALYEGILALTRHDGCSINSELVSMVTLAIEHRQHELQQAQGAATTGQDG